MDQNIVYLQKEYIVGLAYDGRFFVETVDGYTLTNDITKATTYSTYESVILWLKELDETLDFVAEYNIIELETKITAKRLEA
jgi:hypothetical protein